MVTIRSVPIFKLQYDDEFVTRFQEGCASILRSDALAEGDFVRLLEARFMEFSGARHAIAVGSGTDALEVALRSLDVSGKSVIVPANTFIATPIAVERAGGRVVLADIEDETFSISPDALRRSITSDTAAVIIVHIGGMISKYLDSIVSLCDQVGIPLLEDAAHAQGSTFGDRAAGTIGSIGCFSFFPTKVMTTGEGGMITTNDDELFERMRSMKNFGRDLKNPLLCVNHGSNCKMTEFQALLGVLEMDRVRARIEKRNILARRYRQQLQDRRYEVVRYDYGNCSFYKQIVLTNVTRDRLYAHCKAHGVSLTGEVYRFPIHRQPVYRAMYESIRFPVTDKFADGHICPPLYPELEIEDIDYVCEVLSSF